MGIEGVSDLLPRPGRVREQVSWLVWIIGWGPKSEKLSAELPGRTGPLAQLCRWAEPQAGLSAWVPLQAGL